MKRGRPALSSKSMSMERKQRAIRGTLVELELIKRFANITKKNIALAKSGIMFIEKNVGQN